MLLSVLLHLPSHAEQELRTRCSLKAKCCQLFIDIHYNHSSYTLEFPIKGHSNCCSRSYLSNTVSCLSQWVVSSKCFSYSSEKPSAEQLQTKLSMRKIFSYSSWASDLSVSIYTEMCIPLKEKKLHLHVIIQINLQFQFECDWSYIRQQIFHKYPACEENYNLNVFLFVCYVLRK